MPKPPVVRPIENDFRAGTIRERGRQDKPNKRYTREIENMTLEILPMLAEAASNGNIAATLPLAFAGGGAGIGVGLVGAKAAEAVGRNPGAFGNILTMAIIGMALAEAIAIYGLIIAFAFNK